MLVSLEQLPEAVVGEAEAVIILQNVVKRVLLNFFVLVLALMDAVLRFEDQILSIDWLETRLVRLLELEHGVVIVFLVRLPQDNKLAIFVR